MAKTLKFEHRHITDQKRLVRGEHYLYARSRLRARDAIHFKKWRVLTLAGGSPDGEIGTIREILGAKAHITAVDSDSACLDAAIEAGADDVIQCHLADWTFPAKRWHGSNKAPAAAMLNADKFDIINLDLCGNATETTREIIRTYRHFLTSYGVLMVSFSYGRDVYEVFLGALHKTHSPSLSRLAELGASEGVRARLAYLFTRSSLDDVHSVMLYRGNEMPMCSLLLQSRVEPPQGITFCQVERGDFEVGVLFPDVSKMFDCPQERIESLRRSYSAFKAWVTMRQKEQ